MLAPPGDAHASRKVWHVATPVQDCQTRDQSHCGANAPGPRSQCLFHRTQRCWRFGSSFTFGAMSIPFPTWVHTIARDWRQIARIASWLTQRVWRGHVQLGTEHP